MNFRSRVEHLERSFKTDLNRQSFLKSRPLCLSRGKISAETQILLFDLFFTRLPKVFLFERSKSICSVSQDVISHRNQFDGAIM